MSEVELEVLRMAALIHDIGKLMLPDSILLKPGWLTLEERKLMEQHPIEGERICSPLKSLRDVLPIIRHHHERIDGSGYPDRLRRSLIPLGARVLQVVDIFDALTPDRAYRKSVMVPRALTLLSDEVDHGRRDGHLVRQLTSLLIARPYSFAFERLGTSQDSQLG
jgi:putative two-component system response regulator